MKSVFLPLLSVAVLGLSACSNPPSTPPSTPPAPTGTAGAASPLPSTSAAEVGELRRGFLNGYLKPDALPDSLALLPPPPAKGSMQEAADNDIWRKLTALQSGPRGALATQDAELKFPKALQAFSCTLGVEISEAHTPHLNMLMRRTLTDAGLATYKAKDKYQRERPFVAHKAPSCTPAEEAHLSKDGSYPSGHSSVGWAWGLVLGDVAPERREALKARGGSFGQSRAVCGVHWYSDVLAGRAVADATVEKLKTNPTFQAQLKAAQAEVAQARAQGRTPDTATCQAQQAAQALSPQHP